MAARVPLTLALAAVAVLVPAQAAMATTPRIPGPIVSYRCPPVPLWCSKTLRTGVTLQHLRAKMRSGPMQSIYKLSWKLGDPHVNLLAEPLNTPNANGAIAIGTISHWAAASGPPGLLGAINGDFFGSDPSSWNLGDPSGILVHARQVIDPGGFNEPDAVGYEPDGEMIMGTATAKPAKITLRGGRTATIGAFDPSSTALSEIARDQVGVKTATTEPVKVPLGWEGFVVGGNSTVPSLFVNMLRGSAKMTNPTGYGSKETVAGFRFGDNDGVVTKVTLPVSSTACPTYVCAPGTFLQLETGQALVIAQAGLFADKDLRIMALNSHRITVSVDAPRWANVQDVMGGKPQLVKNGNVTYPTANVDPPMMSADGGWQWMYPHWRPAVAESKTRGWLIITGGVDYGDGVYGWNWGKMLVQLGAVNAMGFDNNSSTEMYVPSTGTWTFSPHWEREIAEATALTYR